MQFRVTRVSSGGKPCDEATPHPERPGQWLVDIDHLASLMVFTMRYGDLIVSIHDGKPTIRIYDDYVE